MEIIVGRATFSTTGAVSWNLLTTGIGTACQMSFDAAGQIVVADAGNDEVSRVDPTTGAITLIATGTQPWGTTVNAGAVDPLTGDIYVGNRDSIYRLPMGMTPAVLFATGWSTSTAYTSGFAFDPVTGELVVTLLAVNRVVRVDAGGNFTSLEHGCHLVVAQTLHLPEDKSHTILFREFPPRCIQQL